MRTNPCSSNAHWISFMSSRSRDIFYICILRTEKLNLKHYTNDKTNISIYSIIIQTGVYTRKMNIVLALFLFRCVINNLVDDLQNKEFWHYLALVPKMACKYVINQIQSKHMTLHCISWRMKYVSCWGELHL